jgi:hypothetical protein
MNSKSSSEKNYQTPYGIVKIKRYTYQTSKGGKAWCLLEDRARIIRGGTPRLAKQVSLKYVHMNAQAVCHDFKANHNRTTTKSYIQTMADGCEALRKPEKKTGRMICPNSTPLFRPLSSVWMHLSL